MTQSKNKRDEKELGERMAACCSELDRLLVPRFFKALADPNRVSILSRLATCCTTWTVSQVAEGLPVDVSVVSRHLAILRDAGILNAERRGKEVHYTVRYRMLAQSLRDLATAIEACCADDLDPSEQLVQLEKGT